MNSLQNDTIAAIATPEGTGAIAIIRISGPDSKKILKKVFKPKSKSINIKNLKPQKTVLGSFIHGKSKDFIDQVIVVYYKAPHSYTGEDLVEISIHGGEFIKKLVLGLIIKAGAKPAEPGEFTKRAFLNSKMDLIQAESVANLISSTTEKAYILAKRHLEGKLSNDLAKIIRDLISLKVKLELEIDFSDDFIKPFESKILLKDVKKITKKLEVLESSFQKGNLIKNGFIISIIGKPNVGKSSLLNLLVRKERAIVTHYPGTTRDTIEEILNLKGIPVKLIDTAGIRRSEEPIEEAGIQRSKRAIKESDFLIGVFDITQTFSEEDKNILNYMLKSGKFVLILNKCDLVKKVNIKQFKETKHLKDAIAFSAKNGKGLDKLLKHLEENLIQHQASNIEETSILTEERHFFLIQEALKNLRKCTRNLKENVSPEFPSEDIGFAIESLNKILGININVDILGEIFSNFCIGK